MPQDRSAQRIDPPSSPQITRSFGLLDGCTLRAQHLYGGLSILCAAVKEKAFAIGSSTSPIVADLLLCARAALHIRV